MGFSVKLAPGVRVRASSRGLRTSVGPRAARVHFGSGRTGFSTGAGPVSFYTSVGGNRPSRRAPSTGASSRALAQAAKLEQAKELLAALQNILQLHHPDFPVAQPPIAPPPPEPDRDEINARHRKAALAGIGMFERKARAHAKAAAEAAARAEIAAAIANNQRVHARYQAELDRMWQRLLNNDPEIVLGTLAEAFEDNDAAAAPVGVAGSEASIVVLVPTPAAVPERRPATTSAGNLTLKKLTKREVADFYKLMVCGYVLATVKEAFAVAPGLTHTSIVALRNEGLDAYGRPRVQAILAARFARQALHDVRWTAADATQIVGDASELLTVKQAGPSKEFVPLDLDSEPDIAKVVQAVDVSDLLS
ncbi:DUF4236 domain-containing protein [Actinopolymorpha cephalotaxi]|uniref:Coiled-coil protein SlyX n=2 Tax=Actinopolymorpha cephalotaxi TaxID=504797 RepID=A0ABX2SEM9_9ACTN|nr:DUF4236 domain-containing protein [Actinopolymorpha cephalotaxi]NYH86712.1 putative coiled-coil protein SlyX [Actinopolymorpha cephalotaxi]